MHKSVLLNEVITMLAPQKGAVYVDATFGAGGYTRAILEASNCKVIAFDRDQSVIPIADNFSKEFGERFKFVNAEFSSLANHLTELVDGIVFDIGVSSMQIDQAERGFSFQKDGPLDMRMNKESPTTAEDIVNSYPENQLADVIYNYGDERKSRIIAKKIVEHRKVQRITTTLQLATIVKSAVGRYNDAIDPATRTFQAIRIEVNNELDEIKNAILASKNLVKVGGKILVVTFHSGEDKIVKKLFNEFCGKTPNANRHVAIFDVEQESKADFKLLQKGTLFAGDKELKDNLRSRSARLRGILKIK